MGKILIADDEERMRKLLRDFLEKAGYSVLEAQDGEQALSIFRADNDLDLAILDVMMPKMSGWEVLRSIREDSSLPVIMLTARSEEEDELRGVDLGADEYVTKPFSPRALVARVDAILRRSSGNTGKDILEAGGITIDRAAHTVTSGGNNVDLSIKEYELLEFFIENRGIALSRERILNSVWNYDYFGDARTIDTHVKKLRAKMGDRGSYIKTIWGMGYKFDTTEEEQ